MRTSQHLVSCSAVKAVVAAMLALVLSMPAALAATKPVDKSMKPDFSGIWTKTLLNDPANPPVPIPYQPAYQKKYEAVSKLVKEGRLDLGGLCSPPGVPRMLDMIGQFEIVTSTDKLLILHEYESQIRRIWMNAKHLEKPDQSVNGHSIARYEGNTLVIDTMGLSDFIYLDRNAGPHSKRLHVVERLTLTGPDSMKIEFTVEDPEAFTKPWVYTRAYRRLQDSPMMDYECNENPRNPVNEDGSLGYSFKPADAAAAP